MKSKFRKISRTQHGPIIQKFRIKIILAYFVFAFNFVICRGQGSLNYAKVQVAKVQVIPQPVSVKLKEGYFQINNSTRIVSTSGRTDTVAYMLDSLLNIPTGYHLSPTNRNGENHNNVIIMKLNKTYDTDLGKEGYRLEISSSQIVISANEQNGLFYGMQTLLQLLPSDIASRTVISSVKWIVPCVSIMDYPRFKWRGLMFDVAYKFFSKEFVEKYIDEMAKYKFNVFHWHLTDHQGWRIQIEGLPNLTEIGAWHVPSKGGYYTPQDIREIIAYAKKRFVTIVPEIDVPYHSSALISSYPNISCFNLPAATLCVARDSTWLILNKIFTQVAKMFPSEYIHTGGDEVHTRNWREHSLDQDLMKREGITTIAGLQPYFDRKLEKIISSGGKKMVTWYEYPDRSGLPTSNTIFMAWKNLPGSAIKAINLGYSVVMAPAKYYMHTNPTSLSLPKFYAFEPVPDSVDEKYILGGEGCLWGGINERDDEYKTWPRAMALSEALWSQKNGRSYDNFARRVVHRFKYFDLNQIKYSIAGFEPVIERVEWDQDDPQGVEPEKESSRIKITTALPGVDVYYRFDDTEPDEFSPKFEDKSLDIPLGASRIIVVTYYKGKPVGRKEKQL